MSRSISRITAILVLAAAAVVGWAAPAGAGRYYVAACAYQKSFLPLVAWSSSANAVQGTEVYDHCLSEGRFGGASNHGPAPAGATASWTFSAPANTYIDDYSLYRYAKSVGGSGWTKGYLLYYDQITSRASDAVDSCLASLG